MTCHHPCGWLVAGSIRAAGVARTLLRFGTSDGIVRFGASGRWPGARWSRRCRSALRHRIGTRLSDGIDSVLSLGQCQRCKVSILPIARPQERSGDSSLDREGSWPIRLGVFPAKRHIIEHTGGFELILHGGHESGCIHSIRWGRFAGELQGLSVGKTHRLEFHTDGQAARDIAQKFRHRPCL